jgi:uncharacterized protein YndB with AHSA1/START domain
MMTLDYAMSMHLNCSSKLVPHPGKIATVTNPYESAYSENEMHCKLSMSATTLLPPHSSFPRVHQSATRSNSREHQIAIRATLRADKRRIFDALTLPEYRETWLCLPCSHSNCHTTASQTGSRFRFDHYVAGTLDLSITGCYHVCRRGKVSFTWHKTEAHPKSEHSSESIVQIRLYGEFASSALCLTHTGHFSPDEYRWHCDMWQLSLNKLQSLF